MPGAEVVATDINPAVVEFAAQHLQSERVTFQRADALDLPFDDETFELVLCLFGIMFFPDKVRANAEARRVLRPGGRYVLVPFNRLDLNPVPKAAGAAVATLFPEDPRYMERGPFSYTNAALVEKDPRSAGFQNIELETVELSSVVSAHDAARASCSVLHSGRRSSGSIHRLLSVRRRQSSRRSARGTGPARRCQHILRPPHAEQDVLGECSRTTLDGMRRGGAT